MSVNSPGDLLRHVGYFVQAVVLWDRCRRARIRHIHAHFANVSSDVALLASALGGELLSWSFTMHGPTEFFDIRGHALPQKARDAAFVICVSDFARSQLMARLAPDVWKRLYVVHCGVDVGRFKPRGATTRSDHVRIVCVGRLVPEKGHAVLIEAISTLRRRGLDVHAEIIGDGPERLRLEAMADQLGIGKAVSFPGALAHPDVAGELARADIFCLPSFAEGVPIVLMEAMAMEVPVVASRVMGIPELISDGLDGRLVSPGSVDCLVEALVELAGAPDLRERLGRSGRTKVIESYELHTNTEQLLAVFTRHLEPARPPA